MCSTVANQSGATAFQLGVEGSSIVLLPRGGVVLTKLHLQVAAHITKQTQFDHKADLLAATCALRSSVVSSLQ